MRVASTGLGLRSGRRQWVYAKSMTFDAALRWDCFRTLRSAKARVARRPWGAQAQFWWSWAGLVNGGLKKPEVARAAECARGQGGYSAMIESGVPSGSPLITPSVAGLPPVSIKTAQAWGAAIEVPL